MQVPFNIEGIAKFNDKWFIPKKEWWNSYIVEFYAILFECQLLDFCKESVLNIKMNSIYWLC